MYTTLEHLEKYNKEKKSLKKIPNLIKEFKVFFIIFLFAGVFVLMFTNAELFFANFFGNLGPESKKENIDRQGHSSADASIYSSIEENTQHKEKVQKLIDDHKEQNVLTKNIAASTESILKNNLKNYDFNFNTLPPESRVSIPSINMDVPLVDSKYKNPDDFSNGVFDQELENGVVKYPTTPSPGKKGNTLIFGHTSQERREKNPYGTVFSNLPDLKNGDVVELIREGKLYKYRVFTTLIKKPSDVNETYLQYKDKDYLTLMGCYPLGRTDKRMLVIAERIDLY